MVTLNTKTKTTTKKYNTITNINYIHFVGNGGKKQIISTAQKYLLHSPTPKLKLI